MKRPLLQAGFQFGYEARLGHRSALTTRVPTRRRSALAVDLRYLDFRRKPQDIFEKSRQGAQINSVVTQHLSLRHERECPSTIGTRVGTTLLSVGIAVRVVDRRLYQAKDLAAYLVVAYA